MNSVSCHMSQISINPIAFSQPYTFQYFLYFTNSTETECHTLEGYTGTLSHLWEVVWLDTQLQINCLH